MKNFDIEKFLSLEGYDNDVRKARRKNSEVNSQEFFTPYSIVKKMCDKVSEEDWRDPKKTWLEPCCGNYQFGCYILWNRIQHGVDWKSAVETLYSLDLMEDNIEESKQRVINMFDQMGIEYDIDILKDIMEKNMKVHDFFTWNFEEWRPMTEEEIKQSKKKK